MRGFLAALTLVLPLAAYGQGGAASAEDAPAGRDLDATGAAAPPADQLRQIEAEIEASRARVEALNREAETLADQSKDLRSQLVDAASKVQEQERRLSDIEARLYSLVERETGLVGSLKKRRATIADLVGALESLSINRPPTLGVSPDDATEAARSAMLLGTVIPQLRAQAKTLENELVELTKLRDGIRTEQRGAVNAARTLEIERSHLEDKLADLADRREHAMASVKEEQARLAALAKNAKDVRGLLSDLADRGLAVLPRPKPDQEGEAGEGELQTAALTGIPFRRLKGRLRPPVVGKVSVTFGAAKADGTPSRGAVFSTRANAQVVSPCAGTVVFSGPFRGYGLLLIIQADDGYHFVLAGMARVDAVVRQRLLAGEPVGIMGESGSGPGSDQGQRLYVELRRRGEPLDPVPWLRSKDGKVSG